MLPGSSRSDGFIAPLLCPSRRFPGLLESAFVIEQTSGSSARGPLSPHALSARQCSRSLHDLAREKGNLITPSRTREDSHVASALSLLCFMEGACAGFVLLPHR